MQVLGFTTCYVRSQSAQDAGRIATGFPLPSTGRGIEGEGWSYPEPPPVSSSISPIRGPGLKLETEHFPQRRSGHSPPASVPSRLPIIFIVILGLAGKGLPESVTAPAGCLITLHALRITHHALRITHHALRITHHALRITHDSKKHQKSPKYHFLRFETVMNRLPKCPSPLSIQPPATSIAFPTLNPEPLNLKPL